MKLLNIVTNKSEDTESDKKSIGSQKSNESQDEGHRRNHRLNQNRISAMKCRQKKKQQFQELLYKKESLEKNNLELQEKYDNIQKKLKETKEENDDLKKRLDFMEKQQEILFSIVSESRNSAQRQAYQPPIIQTQPINYQMDQYMRLSSEQKIGGITTSAFKPSTCSSSMDDPKMLVTPTPQLAQMSSVGLNMGAQVGNGISQTQLLSDICATLMGKQI
mmetsp:Transcript_20782/g.18409  ORF Transcript_20782/g.18409 Transcript_20782/m.18409 type:complete len:219 (+) Transcript_20782:27-683(+)